MQPALSSLCIKATLSYGIYKRFPKVIQQAKCSMSTQYETLNVSMPKDHVLHVQFNRPKKRNAMNQQFFKDVHNCFQNVHAGDDIRAVVVSGAGKMFSAGLDFMDFASVLMSSDDKDVSRKALQLRSLITELQRSFNVLEEINAPVIAAVHNGCVGGGVDLISACDIRLCSNDAWFQVKEIDLAIVADLGTLQRLPKIIGNHSLARELCFTGRKLDAAEAEKCGLVSKVCKDYDTLIDEAINLGSTIAEKSPVTIAGIKHQLNYARDHSVQDGLNQVLTWNMSAVQSEDLPKAVQGMMGGEKPVFSKL